MTTKNIIDPCHVQFSYLQEVLEGLCGCPRGWLLAHLCPRASDRPAHLKAGLESRLLKHPVGKVGHRSDLTRLVGDHSLQQLEKAPQRPLDGGAFLVGLLGVGGVGDAGAGASVGGEGVSSGSGTSGKVGEEPADFGTAKGVNVSG